MKIVVDALMFIIFECNLHHCMKKNFSLKEVEDILTHDVFKMVEYSKNCIGMIKKAMEILRDKFCCTFVIDRKFFPKKQL